MIELTVNAAGLARSRFAVSPLHEVVATLLPWGLQPAPDADPWVARARRVLRRARLPLLSELALDGPGYVPDFLNPYPSDPSPTVEEELERVRCTPPERVLSELEALRVGRPRNGLAGAELSEGVRRAMARGGAHVARQAADEMRRYWELAFAPHWEAAKAVLDAELGRCAGVPGRTRGSAAFQLPASRHRVGWRHPARREPITDRAASADGGRRTVTGRASASRGRGPHARRRPAPDAHLSHT
jgi:hypothetical protein